jgi:hypothetical protein
LAWHTRADCQHQRIGSSPFQVPASTFPVQVVAGATHPNSMRKCECELYHRRTKCAPSAARIRWETQGVRLSTCDRLPIVAAHSQNVASQPVP